MQQVKKKGSYKNKYSILNLYKHKNLEEIANSILPISIYLITLYKPILPHTYVSKKFVIFVNHSYKRKTKQKRAIFSQFIIANTTTTKSTTIHTLYKFLNPLLH